MLSTLQIACAVRFVCKKGAEAILTEPPQVVAVAYASHFLSNGVVPGDGTLPTTLLRLLNGLGVPQPQKRRLADVMIAQGVFIPAAYQRSGTTTRGRIVANDDVRRVLSIVRALQHAAVVEPEWRCGEQVERLLEEVDLPLPGSLLELVRAVLGVTRNQPDTLRALLLLLGLVVDDLEAATTT